MDNYEEKYIEHDFFQDDFALGGEFTDDLSEFPAIKKKFGYER